VVISQRSFSSKQKLESKMFMLVSNGRIRTYSMSMLSFTWWSVQFLDWVAHPPSPIRRTFRKWQRRCPLPIIRCLYRWIRFQQSAHIQRNRAGRQSRYRWYFSGHYKMDHPRGRSRRGHVRRWWERIPGFDQPWFRPLHQSRRRSTDRYPSIPIITKTLHPDLRPIHRLSIDMLYIIQ